MNLFNISLFIHILALFAAGVATGITKLGAGRQAKARTVNEALEWLNITLSASKIFPVAALAFVVTGVVMMIAGHVRFSSSGFIVAGLVGTIVMTANGIYLGKKGDALKQVLEGLAKQNGDQPMPNIAPPALVAVLPLVNTVLGLTIAFIMVVKPLSISFAFSILAVAAILAVVAAKRSGAIAVRTHAPSPASGRQSLEVPLSTD